MVSERISSAPILSSLLITNIIPTALISFSLSTRASSRVMLGFFCSSWLAVSLSRLSSHVSSSTDSLSSFDMLDSFGSLDFFNSSASFISSDFLIPQILSILQLFQVHLTIQCCKRLPLFQLFLNHLIHHFQQSKFRAAYSKYLRLWYFFHQTFLEIYQSHPGFQYYCVLMWDHFLTDLHSEKFLCLNVSISLCHI